MDQDFNTSVNFWFTPGQKNFIQEAFRILFQVVSC